MPLYEYQCSKCGNIFEVIQKFSDEPLTVHEGCGGEVVRLISRSAFQLKGSGWYITDYARGSGAKGDSGKTDGAKTGTKAETKSETKSESSSETKSETKTESKPAPAASKKSE